MVGALNQPRQRTTPSPRCVAIFGQSFFGDGSLFGQVDAPRRKSKHHMASNPLPGPNDKLFAKAARMIKGLHDLEVIIGVKQNTEPPTCTTLIAGVPAKLLADWDDALRADHYRVWIFIVGVDTAFRAVESPNDSDATLSDLPSGATVRCYVTAVNGVGESQPGPEAQAVVP